MINYFYIVSLILYGARNIICQNTETPDPECDQESLDSRGLVFGGEPNTQLYYFDEEPKNYDNFYYVSCDPNKINFTFYYNNNTEIKLNDRYQMEIDQEDPPSITFSIINITVFDSGIYTFEARKGTYNSTKHMNITVDDVPKPLLYEDDGKYICNVTGYPTPEVTWFFKAKDLGASKVPVSKNTTIWKSISQYNWFESYYIYVNETELKDVEYLYCVGENEYASKTAELHKKVPETPDPECDQESLDSRGLVFGGEPNTQLYYVDEEPKNYDNFYYVSCDPNKMNFTFYDNHNTKIKLNGRYQMEIDQEDPPSITFSIINITVYDSGIYTFEARKGTYNSTKHMNITVDDVPSPLLYEDNGKYICNVTGYPTPEVTWFFRAKDLDVKTPVWKNTTIWKSISLYNWFESYYIYVNETELKDVEYLYCVGENEYASKTAELHKKVPESTNNGLIIGIILLLIILIIIAGLCYKFFAIVEDSYYSACSKYKPGMKLRVAGLLPSYGDLECPKEKFTQGTFGQMNVMKTDQRITHTSKTNDIRKLVAELNTITSLGRHLNIIKIIDVSTEGRINGELFISKERCEYGDILEYIKDNKQTLVLAANEPIPRSEGTWLIPHYRTVSSENPLYNSLCTQDWLKAWAFQVACGMDFLQSQDIFYKSTQDLLLSENGVVKITKFCHRENVALYEPTKKAQALGGSDFRSYAVFLRQLFSLGDAPEPEVINSRKIENREDIELMPKGDSLEKPTYANEEIQEVMLQCWKAPGNGMQFSQIATTLEGLNPRVHSYYIRLNNDNKQYNNQNASDRNAIKVAWDEKRNASHKCLPELKCYSLAPSQEVA